MRVEGCKRLSVEAEQGQVDNISFGLVFLNVEAASPRPCA